MLLFLQKRYEDIPVLGQRQSEEWVEVLFLAILKFHVEYSEQSIDVV